jgi:hypothetical protein
MNINSDMYQYFNTKEYLQPTQSVSWVAEFENEHELFDTADNSTDKKFSGSSNDDSYFLRKLDLLKPFMWEQEKMTSEILPSLSISSEVVVPAPEPPDSLFWCIYAGVAGMNDYFTITKKSNRELEEKQKIVEFIQKNTEKIKSSNHKTTKVMIQEIMSELLSNREINIQSLIVFSVFYNVNIYLVKKNVYYIFKGGEDYESTTEDARKNIFIFHKKQNIYSLQEDNENTTIESIEQNCFLIENIKKPLKAASFYKFSCLEKIALKFNINSSACKTKKELYDVLSEKICTHE